MPIDPLTKRQRKTDDGRTGRGIEAFQRAFRDNLFYAQARFPEVASRNDLYMALAHTVRDHLMLRWVGANRTYHRERSRTVCYLSAEFLLGPHTGNNLLNLGLLDEAREALAGLGLDLEVLLEQEEEPGLGNGGLGRLAACYLDSLATRQIPAIGYGVRYEYGIFDQRIVDGEQVEESDNWLRLGNPWELARPEIAHTVGLGGHTETYVDEEGHRRARWVPGRTVLGVAHDTPILGYRVQTANLLRLWSARAPAGFDFAAFNVGDYYRAVEEKVVSENLTKVLYPNDEALAGRRLRLEQQHFFVSCSLQDMVRIHRQTRPDLTDFAERYVAQLNDTHPALAIPELMRLLVDEHRMDWDLAWDVTRRTFAYTNHTLLPEALETWSLPLFREVLPRHTEIVFEINRRHLEEVGRRFPGDTARIARMSLIDEAGRKSVRMANLACVGSHAINGVARLHTELLKRGVLRDFHEMSPEAFSNKTNGVTPRRFVALANPSLARLITSRIGDAWIGDLARIRDIEPLADDPAFRAEWREARRANKRRLTGLLAARAGVTVDPDSLFDVLAKRIHEYKRQHLQVLHLITLYRRLKQDPDLDVPSRTAVFAGKAAPGYAMAKRIIRLIHGVAEVVNADPDVRDRLRVVFLPDFNVKCAQPVYPAADLSEQISLAGKEASGTGNMKFAMNGALTIGTLDGANVEIREAVGTEHFFLFGLTVEGVERTRPGYRPQAVYEADTDLRRTIDLIASGVFSRGDRDLFRPLVDALLDRDEYLCLADYASFLAAQRSVEAAWRDTERWTRSSILTAARMGHFSSDRAIQEYCDDVWKVRPVPAVTA
jgi:starch phosphorylase